MSPLEEDRSAIVQCDSPDHWLGFYDWLKTREGRVIGIRLHVDSSDTLSLVSRHAGPGVAIANRAISIRISIEDTVDELLSDDQDFGDNEVFVGRDGSLAITFFSPDVNPPTTPSPSNTP